MEPPSSERVRFADFEFNCRTGDLRRGGTPSKLQPQPAKILAFLVQRAGQVVTRQELFDQVWGSGTFVDFEQGLNYAVRQIRIVLEDDPDHPRFLETLPKRGYRFIAPVIFETPEPPVIQPPAPEPLVVQQAVAPPVSLASARLRLTASRFRFALSGLAVVAATILLLVLRRDDLRHRWFGNPARHRIESLAVLPLHNLSQDPEQEYFSEGMTDELITDLAKVSGLRVISHTSVERYKGTKRTIPEIARELGVDAVIEGTVRRSGDRIRITVQLIDAQTDQHLWAESYERTTQDVLNLQEEVARHIVTEVGVKLTDREQLRLRRAALVDPAAHEAYLKGKFYWSQSSCSAYEKALEFFQQAIAKDPTFAPTYAGLADTYFSLADSGCWPKQRETFAKSKAAVLKAVELDPSLALAHCILAELAFYQEWDWPKAEKEFRRSIDLDSNDAGTRMTFSVFLIALGQREQALSELSRAHALDPVSEVTSMLESYVFYLDHNFDRAIDQANKALELYPHSAATYYWLGQSYEQKGKTDQALAAYLNSSSHYTPDWKKNAELAYQKDGMPGYWRQRMKESNTHGGLDECFNMMYYAHMKDRERTLAALKLGYEHHCDGLQFLKVEPIYDSFRDDPRFKELTLRLGL